MSKTNALSAAKHTPGPWAVIESASGKPRVIADHPQYGDIARLFGQAAEANARLIAAAPEMLALLQRFERFSASTGFSYPLGSLQELQVLIAKATGSAACTTHCQRHEDGDGGICGGECKAMGSAS